jgi:S-adenosylmethionine decarboxylase
VSASKHVVLDFYGCNRRIGDGESVRAALVAAALAARAEVVDSWMRAQPVVGIVAAVIIPEAHILFHAYPDYGYAAVDILFADQDFDAEACQGYLEQFFSPAAVVRRELYRGGDSQGNGYRQ